MDHVVGDDSTLNDQALVEALAAGPVVLDPGVYRFARRFDHLGSLSLRGTPGRTIVRWTGASAGLRVTLRDPWSDRVQLEGVTLLTATDAPTAVEITSTPLNAGLQRAVVLRDLEMRPDTILTGGAFSTGVIARHLWFPLLENVTVHHRPSPQPAPGTGGIVCAGRTMGATIAQSLISHVDFAIALTEDGEAIRVTDTNLLGVTIGLFQSSTRPDPPPVGWMSNCHAAAKVRGVYVTKGAALQCVNSSVYRWTSTPGEFVAFQCRGGGGRHKFVNCEAVNTSLDQPGQTYGFVSDGQWTQWVGCSADGFTVPWEMQGAAHQHTQLVGGFPA